jgi:peptidoglycan hydrolase CwlO-like protein
MLMVEKNNLIQKLQNINDEYLILHNDKNQLEKEIKSLKNQINFEKEYEATWGKVDMANIVDSVCGDINEVTTPISSEEVDVLAHMAGWEKAGY